MKGENVPISGRLGHSANLWKHYIVIFGGEGEYNLRLKRRDCYNDIFMFNLENNSWSLLKIKGNIIEHRRSIY